MPKNGELQCYNRGCGQTFDPEKNMEGSCTYHPGEPFFHDAYKGWTCCKKKCTDFTEFLNFKGCTRGYHNPEKPAAPERPAVDKSDVDEVIEYVAPRAAVPEPMERPSQDTPLVELKPDVSAALVKEVLSLTRGVKVTPTAGVGVPVGTSCKNSGCKQTYSGPCSDDETCTYHTGFPVFHEGLKFWTCCQRRTTDFSVFLNQEGCSTGKHMWIKEKAGDDQKVTCRYDWHQTGKQVVVSVFAKKYDPSASWVQLNPVRLVVHLLFPEDSSSFDMDLELRGVVNVGGSSASMLPTKLEVRLAKAEVGSWHRLDIPRAPAKPQKSKERTPPPADSNITDEPVDLGDIC